MKLTPTIFLDVLKYIIGRQGPCTTGKHDEFLRIYSLSMVNHELFGLRSYVHSKVVHVFIFTQI